MLKEQASTWPREEFLLPLEWCQPAEFTAPKGRNTQTAVEFKKGGLNGLDQAMLVAGAAVWRQKEKLRRTETLVT